MITEFRPFLTQEDTPHPNGQWCQKILGKIHFFGTWDDPQAAVDRYHALAADLHAGREPRPEKLIGGDLVVKDACNGFLNWEKEKLDSGEMGGRWFSAVNSCALPPAPVTRSLGSSEPAGGAASHDPIAHETWRQLPNHDQLRRFLAPRACVDEDDVGSWHELKGSRVVVMETSAPTRPAGFWVRFAALWVDAALLYVALGATTAIFAKLGVYIPFEITFIVLAIIYSVFLITWKGQTIEKGERAIVWVGAAHSYINYRRPGFISNGKVVTEFSRMGFLLHRKYGDDVFQILLHDGHYESLEGAIRRFIEQIAHGRQDRPVGFDVVGSPFALLRDSNGFFFRHQPGVCFSDLAAGYVFLKPIKDQETCDWLEGYISEDMFVENKPYYEAKCGRNLKSSEEANRFVSQR